LGEEGRGHVVHPQRGIFRRRGRACSTGGAHPAIGDCVCFAPPLVITETEIDRMVSIAAESVNAVVGA
jgi:adenosylmethionine-8-amino-7-oxononanoate aminotransferase